MYIYVGTVQDIPSIDSISTNAGHRFGHQSGPDESSGQNRPVYKTVFRFAPTWCFQVYVQPSNIIAS